MMTAQPPSYDPQNFRSDAVPSDTQAIYIQEGGDSASNLFNLPSKHPKILRLQEIMIVSAIICFIHGLISAFAPGNAKPLEGLPEFGVAGGIGLLVVSAAVYLTVYFMVQNGNRLGLTIGLIFAILGGLIAIMSLLGNILDTQRYGFVPLYAGDGGLSHYLNMPALSALLLWGLSALTHSFYPAVSHLPGPLLPESGLFFILTAALLATMWVACVRLVMDIVAGMVGDGRREQVWVAGVMMAASPLVAVHAFTNVDTPAIAASIGMMWALQHRRLRLAGVLLGVGVALKLWPIILLFPLLILGLRCRERLHDFVVVASSMIVTWTVVNLPFIVMMPQDWLRFYELISTRTAEWTSIYAVIGRMQWLSGWDGYSSPLVLNIVSIALFLGGCLLQGKHVVSAESMPSIESLNFLVMGSFLLVNKVWSPQYSLWLLPCLVLAYAAIPRPPWRLVWVYGIVEVVLWLIAMWHMLGEDNLGVPHEMLDVVVVIRWFLVGVMMVTYPNGQTRGVRGEERATVSHV